MSNQRDQLLITSLDLLEEGHSVEQILARFPADVAVLRPFLQTATQLNQLSSQPTIAAQQQSQATFLAQAAIMKESKSQAVPFWFNLRRLLLPAASLVIILFLLSTILLSASAKALPGDQLYGLKRSVENYRLLRVSDPQAFLLLANSFEEERRSEVKALLQAGRSADVEFEGVIESIGLDSWVISGLPIQLTADTVIEGTPRIGEEARIYGRTTNGQLLAGLIQVFAAARDPEPTPTPRPTQQPARVPLIEPTITATPSATVSPTPSSTSSATPTATATETAKATAVPTATPTNIALPPTATPDNDEANQPPANDNDDENNNEDSGNDNGDDDNQNDNDDNSNGDDDNNNDDNENSNDDSSNDNSDNDNNNDDENNNDNEDEGDGNDNSNEDEGDSNSNEDNDNSGSSGDNDDDNGSGGEDDDDNG